MSTFINLNESKLMEYYEAVMDEVYLQYFTFPSEIPNIPISDADRADMSYYESMGRGLASMQGVEQKPWYGGNPWHLMGLADDLFIRRYGIDAFRKIEAKRVKFHNDPRYCNGLLRRERGQVQVSVSRNANEFLSCLGFMFVALMTAGAIVLFLKLINGG